MIGNGRSRSGAACLRQTLVVACALITACASVEADDSAPPTVTVAPVSVPAPPTAAATTDAPETTEPSKTTDSPETTDPPDTTDQPDTTDPYETTDPYLTDPTEPATTDDTTVDTTARPPLGDPPTLARLADAVAYLTPSNDAVSVTVWRDHKPIFAEASGTGATGQAVTPDTPLVLASVSKLVTALTVARLVEHGDIDLDAPMPWALMGIAHDPGWDTVTPRELLAHSGGMPKVQNLWINLPGTCRDPLTQVLAFPPAVSRGKWVYSNGNYCALGLFIEAVTGADRDDVARLAVFDPIDVDGPHLSRDGLLPGDGPYREGVGRLERLGGAGTWIASTDDIAAMLDSVTDADLETMVYPGIFTDQYGWGHTGTIDGAKSCAWVIENGRTVIVAIVAGNKPSTGGKVCDAVIPAVAADLGIWADIPYRIPA